MSRTKSRMPVSLENVEVVLLQFRLTEEEYASACLPQINVLLPEGTGKKKNSVLEKGDTFLSPTKLNLFQIYKDLLKTYALTDTFRDKNPNVADHLIQFTFTKRGLNRPKTVDFKCLNVLHVLCRRTVWRTQGYINPCETKEKKMVAINCHRPNRFGATTWEKINLDYPFLYASDEQIDVLQLT